MKVQLLTGAKIISGEPDEFKTDLRMDYFSFEFTIFILKIHSEV